MNSLWNRFHPFIIPTEANNYRPRLIHLNVLTYNFLFVLFLTVIIRSIGGATGGVLGFATDISLQKLNDLTNEKRLENGLQPLNYNDNLSQAARAKAQDMFANDYWAHFSPTGASPWNFIVESGYEYEFAGENLAKNFLFSSGVVDAWMQSPSHRANILRSDYTDVGYAVVNGVLQGEETTLVVQMFAKPLTNAKGVIAQPVRADTVPNYQEGQHEDADTITKTEEVQTAQQTSNTPPAQAVVLANKNQVPFWNIFPTVFGFNMVYLAVIGFVLIIDITFAAKYHLFTIRGKHLAHLLFIGFISIGIMMIIVKGAIL